MDGFKLEDIFGKWFWITAGVAAAGVCILLIAWYVQHPDRSPFEDFARKVDIPASNGSVPHPAPAFGVDTVEGQA